MSPLAALQVAGGSGVRAVCLLAVGTGAPSHLRDRQRAARGLVLPGAMRSLLAEVRSAIDLQSRQLEAEQAAVARSARRLVRVGPVRQPKERLEGQEKASGEEAA